VTLGANQSQRALGSTSVGTYSLVPVTPLIQTPEPTTTVAALAGAPLLALGAWMRRRKAQA